jgi:MFS family permease
VVNLLSAPRQIRLDARPEGVYLAEVARRAPEGQVGVATGGTQFFTFLGALAGPPLFAASVSATGEYGSGFAVFAVLPMLAAVLLLVRRNR